MTAEQRAVQKVPQAQRESWGGRRAQNIARKDGNMKKLFAAVLSVAVATSLSPALTSAQSTSCPAEVGQAKEMLAKKQTASINSQDVQAPRSLAGARSNPDIQSPRGNQDVQSPRGNQDVQAPRSLAGARQNDSIQSPRGNQDVQSPRGNQDVQSPRGNQDVQSPRGNQNLQSPRGNQDVQSPRGNQHLQSPRGDQDVQSPRANSDVQSPRGNQNVQSPRSSTGATASTQAPRADISKAASLVKDAEAACKSGNMTVASDKAKAAIELLK